MNSFFSILINGNHRAFAFPKIIQSESSQVELLADIVPYEMFEILILYDTYSDKVKSFKDINDIVPSSNNITEDTYFYLLDKSFVSASYQRFTRHETCSNSPKTSKRVQHRTSTPSFDLPSIYLSIWKKRKSEEKKKRKKGLDDWPESRDTAVAFSIVIKPFRGGPIDRSFETRGWTINDRVLQARTAGYSAT